MSAVRSRALRPLPGLALLATVGAQGPTSQPATAPDLESRQAAAAGVAQALDYILQNQHPDGSWGTSNRSSQFDGFFAYSSFYGCQVAAHSLMTLALLQAPETAPRRAALERAVRWLVTTPVPLRSGRDRPIWAWLYGLQVMAIAVKDTRFQDETWLPQIAARGREFAGWIQKNQEPAGGVGYYDYEPYQRGATRTVESATSFTTSAALPPMVAARELGWLPADVVERAVVYVRRCRVPNGAYQYHLSHVPSPSLGGEHIDNVKGSLGRIQVSHWALHQGADPTITDAVARRGVELFFEHHQFLDVARMRPVPHEAYYLNAGYFYFFGHYYCAHTINLLPAAEREAFHRQLRRHVLKAKRPDGSYCDFLGTPYLVHASTAYAAMALLAGLGEG